MGRRSQYVSVLGSIYDGSKGGRGEREKRGRGVPTVTYMYSRREIERRGRGFQDEKGYILPGKFYGQGAEICALLRQYDSLRGSGRDRGRLVL